MEWRCQRCEADNKTILSQGYVKAAACVACAWPRGSGGRDDGKGRVGFYEEEALSNDRSGRKRATEDEHFTQLQKKRDSTS